MPFGVVILGAFLTAAVCVLIPHTITGTTASDLAIKQFTPLGVIGCYLLVLVVGFWGRN